MSDHVRNHRFGSKAVGDRNGEEITKFFRVPNPKREQARSLQGPSVGEPIPTGGALPFLSGVGASCSRLEIECRW